MDEQFLQFLWQHGLYDRQDMRTAQGEPIVVLSAGIRNTNAGPDFTDARVKIGGILWAGNVEVHRSASDWQKHCHHLDRAYDSVILHVVQRCDCHTLTSGGTPIATCEMRYDKSLEQRYLQLQNSDDPSCKAILPPIESFRWQNFLTRLAFERLQHRAHHIADLLCASKNDWESVFFRMLFRSFGFGVNADPMEQLAQSVTPAQIAKHRDSLPQLEALLFGQAGLLSDLPADEYQNQLSKEYALLQAKFVLTPLPCHIWKFMRTRPVNFPTVRIAQLAALLHSAQNLFARSMEAASPAAVTRLFAVSASEYWNARYRFENSSSKQNKTLGENSIQRIAANVVIPVMYHYGKAHNDESFCTRAVALMEQIPPEENAKVSVWRRMMLPPCNMLESQALLQLASEYCGKRRCLCCAIGRQIVETPPIV